jgi:hypothetical protein
MKKCIFVLCSLLLLVMVLITAGCGGTTTTPALTPADILMKSYDAMQGLNSFHAVLSQVGGGTPIVSGIEMTGVQGDVVRPDKLQITIDGTAMGMTIQVKMVTVGTQTLMTNPLSGKWEALSAGSQFNVLAVFNPGVGVAAIVKGMTGLNKLADEQVGDALCYHLSGGIASEALKPLTGSSITGATVNAEVWIGQTDFLVRQVKLTGKITDGEKDGIVRTLTLSDFNKPVEITLPQ